MKKIIAVSTLMAGFFTIGVAQAQTALTTSLGTTGGSLHLSAPLRADVNARIGVNGFNYSHSGSARDVDYDFKLKFNTFDALIDWYPLSNGFHVTAGAAYNRTKIDADGESNNQGVYTVNGRQYTAASLGSLDGRVKFRKLAPYVGIGWGNPMTVQKGWSFFSDLGVYFQGSADTSLNNRNCALPTAAQCAQLASDVSAENANLRDKARDYKYYPVLRVGASYKF